MNTFFATLLSFISSFFVFSYSSPEMPYENIITPIECREGSACDHANKEPIIDTSIEYRGLTQEEAERLAAYQGVRFRVIVRDGESLPATMDYIPGRINATITNGIVTHIDREGQENQELFDATSWETIISKSCMSFFDGCNTCRRNPENGIIACTKKFCMQYEKPYCL